MSLDRLEKLQQLSDRELFEIDTHLAVEYVSRMIELLEKNEITQFTFDCKIPDMPMTTVFDYDKGNKDISVQSVGYSIDMFGTKRLRDKYLYLIDENDTVYSGDDCILNNTLWDVYSAMKEILK